MVRRSRERFSSARSLSGLNRSNSSSRRTKRLAGQASYVETNRTRAMRHVCIRWESAGCSGHLGQRGFEGSVAGRIIDAFRGPVSRLTCHGISSLQIAAVCAEKPIGLPWRRIARRQFPKARGIKISLWLYDREIGRSTTVSSNSGRSVIGDGPVGRRGVRLAYFELPSLQQGLG